MDTTTIIVRLYSSTDKEVLEKALRSMGISPERYSFDTYHESYAYNEASLKLTVGELETLQFRLGLIMPNVYEFG